MADWGWMDSRPKRSTAEREEVDVGMVGACVVTVIKKQSGGKCI